MHPLHAAIKVCKSKKNDAKIPGCGRELPLSSFYTSKETKNGYESVCKNCKSLRGKQIYHAIPEEIKRVRQNIQNENRRLKSSGNPVGRPRENYRDDINIQCAICKECRAFLHLFRTYGLTQDHYLTMLEYQNHLCACCKIRPPRYVDHNHETGEVRGLLCQPCNTALGFVMESEALIDRLKEYLIKHNSLKE
jgi:hypothetical protein